MDRRAFFDRPELIVGVIVPMDFGAAAASAGNSSGPHLTFSHQEQPATEQRFATAG
jgi:hypothetical protein